MKITVHRGTHQIGGCVTEIASENDRIFIDFGTDLPGCGGAPATPILGLTVPDGTNSALFLTHYHGDHIGRLKEVAPDDKALLRRSVPLLGSDFMREEIFAAAQPQSLSDLIRLFGLAHGVNTWKDNAGRLLKTHACSLADIIAVQEDIFYALCDQGVETETAVDIMKAVSCSRGLTEEQAAIIRSAGLPDWYADSCRKIRYLSMKSLAIGYALTDLRLAWYQIHFPTEYAAACSDEQKG